jgi:hypothetical protein
MRYAGTLQKGGRSSGATDWILSYSSKRASTTWVKSFYRPHTICSVWTLIDSDESDTCIPPAFVQRNRPFFVIYTLSPAEERWAHVHGSVSFPKVVVMNPWSRSEIYRAYVMSYCDNAQIHPHSIPISLVHRCTWLVQARKSLTVHLTNMVQLLASASR